MVANVEVLTPLLWFGECNMRMQASRQDVLDHSEEEIAPEDSHEPLTSSNGHIQSVAEQSLSR